MNVLMVIFTFAVGFSGCEFVTFLIVRLEFGMRFASFLLGYKTIARNNYG